MEPREVGVFHPAIPRGIIGKIPEKVLLATDHPQTNNNRKTHMRLEDVIPRTAVMLFKKEGIPAIRTEEEIKSLYRNVRTLRRGIHGAQHQWPQV